MIHEYREVTEALELFDHRTIAGNSIMTGDPMAFLLMSDKKTLLSESVAAWVLKETLRFENFKIFIDSLVDYFDTFSTHPSPHMRNFKTAKENQIMKELWKWAWLVELVKLDRSPPRLHPIDLCAEFQKYWTIRSADIVGQK